MRTGAYRSRMLLTTGQRRRPASRPMSVSTGCGHCPLSIRWSSRPTLLSISSSLMQRITARQKTWRAEIGGVGAALRPDTCCVHGCSRIRRSRFACAARASDERGPRKSVRGARKRPASGSALRGQSEVVHARDLPPRMADTRTARHARARVFQPAPFSGDSGPFVCTAAALAQRVGDLPDLKIFILQTMKNSRSTVPSPRRVINTSYNNFRIRLEQERVKAASVKPRPWTINIDGMVEKPQEIGLDDLIRKMPLEERLFATAASKPGRWPFPERLPLAGSELAQPLSSAKYLRMEPFDQRSRRPTSTWCPASRVSRSPKRPMSRVSSALTASRCRSSVTRRWARGAGAYASNRSSRSFVYHRSTAEELLGGACRLPTGLWANNLQWRSGRWKRPPRS